MGSFSHGSHWSWGDEDRHHAWFTFDSHGELDASRVRLEPGKSTATQGEPSIAFAWYPFPFFWVVFIFIGNDGAG